MAEVTCPVVNRQRVSLARVYDISQGGPVATRVDPGTSVAVSVHTTLPVQSTPPSDYELVPYDQQSAFMNVGVRVATQEGGTLGTLSASKTVFQATGSWGSLFGVQVPTITWTTDTLTVTVSNANYPSAVFVVITTVTMDVDLVTRQCQGVSPPPLPPPGGVSMTAAATPFTVARGETVTLYASVRTSGAQALRTNLSVRAPDGSEAIRFSEPAADYAAGQTRTFQETWVVPGAAALGQYTVDVEVRTGDDGAQLGRVPDAARFSVVQVQNATVTVSASPASVQPGQTVALQVQVTNTSSTARAFTVALDIRGPVPGTLNLAFPLLDPSASATQTTNWAAPQATGTYIVAATVWDSGIIQAQQDRAATITVLENVEPPPPPPPSGGAIKGFRLRWTRRRVPSDHALTALGGPVRITLDRLGFAARPFLLVGLRRRVSLARDQGGVRDEHEYWLAPWPQTNPQTNGTHWAQVESGWLVQGDASDSTLAARVEYQGRVMP